MLTRLRKDLCWKRREVFVFCTDFCNCHFSFLTRTHKRYKNKQTDLEEDCDEMKEIEEGANQEGIYLNETGMLFKKGRSLIA